MASSHSGTIYFFHETDPHGVFSQFYALPFQAPLPTYASITSSRTASVEGGPSAATAPSTATTPSTEPSSSTKIPVSSNPSHTFKFAEQYMMYAKAITFNDAATATAILSASTPKKCKGLGRQVEGFSDETWKRYREAVVEEGNWYKFTGGQGEAGRKARRELLQTGNKELVEASPFDRVWGVGFRETEAPRNRARWGENLLGKAIMRVRRRVREAVEGGEVDDGSVQEG